MSKGTKTAVIILSILVVLSLALNGYLLWQWWRFQQRLEETAQAVAPQIRQAITQAVTDLEAFENSTLEFEIQVQQEFPVEVEIPFNETIDVPIQTTLPISQAIETTIMIDPFQTGLSIPTDVRVPVNLEVPIDLNIPVSVDRTIPIATDIPLDLNVPISIAINETELAPYLERLRTGLEAFEDSLSLLEQ